jgi:hypothetical protein
MLNHLSESHLLAGDVGRAGECARQALAAARERGERGFEAAALRMLAAVATRSDSPDPVAAREHYFAALELADTRGMQPLIAHCHDGLAVVQTRLGDAASAETHRTQALEIYRRIGMTPPPSRDDREESRMTR